MPKKAEQFSGFSDFESLEPAPSGPVYKAVDQEGTEVVIQVLLTEWNNYAAFSEYLLANKKGLLALGEQVHIVAMRDIVQLDSGMLGVVEEFALGENLGDRLETSTSPIDRQIALDYLAKILSAVEFAHRKGVYHAGLTAWSVFIQQSGRVKVRFGVPQFWGGQYSLSELEGPPGKKNRNDKRQVFFPDSDN